MLLNLLLLALVFGASKRKLQPYLAGLILGGIKGALYLFVTQSVVAALVMGGLFGGCGAGLVYLLDRLDKKPRTPVDPAKMYKTVGAEKGAFRWEYIPLSAMVLFVLGGEWLFALVKIAE